MKCILYFVIIATFAINFDLSDAATRGKRQFNNFGLFGPTGGPLPAVFDGHPNFISFTPVNNRRDNRQTGLTIPFGSGNIIPRPNNSGLRQFFPQQQQQQQQQQPQQQQSQQQVTRNSPAFRQCMANCPTTNQYNPVCGSDQQNYFNEARLTCAQSCGMNVQSVRRGTCSTNNSN